MCAPFAQDSITAISGYYHAKKFRVLVLCSSLHYILFDYGFCITIPKKIVCEECEIALDVVS
jgi:hypothetical protein